MRIASLLPVEAIHLHLRATTSTEVIEILGGALNRTGYVKPGFVAATLARGYAVVQAVDAGGGAVLRSVSNAPAGTRLRIRVADGALNAISSGPTEGEI